MTPQTHAQLACGGKVRIVVTLDDGTPVVDLTADVLAVDRRDVHELVCLVGDNQTARIPLEPVAATVLPLPRPSALRGAR
jgi:hypothetical protein